MYFFQSVLLILLTVISSCMLYQYFSNHKELRKKLSKKFLVLLYLIFIQAIFVIFSNYKIVLIFLDLPCFLGYFLKKRKDAFLLSMVNVIFFSMCLNIPFYYYFIYLGYFLIDSSMNKKDVSTWFLLIKAFFTSFVYFVSYSHNNFEISCLVFSLLYFYVMLKFSYTYLKEFEIEKNDDTLIFQIAHEVKNPIAVCKGYLDMIDTNQKEKVNKYIPIVRSEMTRALRIMDDFLNLKRLTVEKELMDLSLLLEDTKATMDTILNNQNISLELTDVDDEILIDGDYDRLKQVFVNMIKNAYEAHANKIKISLHVHNEKVEILIQDNGDGIDKKDLNKIGELFYTTKSKGNGIGVCMSQEIIKLHQGFIKYSSKLGEGTTVKIILPVSFCF